MYSRDITMQRNRSLGNVVGTFVMYSHNVKYLSNLVAASGGAAGMGLGVKESGDLTVTNNILLRNTLSVCPDTSPIQLHQRMSLQATSSVCLMQRWCFTAVSAAIVFRKQLP